MKFLIAGLGSIGSRHAKNLLALGHDVWVYRKRNQVIEPNKGLESLRVYSDFNVALDAAPDAVVVANPTRFHIQTAQAAVDRGLPVFIEKPLSDSLEGLDRLEAMIEEKSIKSCMVGFNYRFHPGLIWLKKQIDVGKIGKVQRIDAEAGEYLPDWHPWEDYRISYIARPELGGGRLTNCCHEIDDVLWLLGSRPTEVRGSCENLGELGLAVDETADIELRFQQGVDAVIRISILQKPPRRIISVEGSAGRAEWNYFGGHSWVEAGGKNREIFDFKQIDRNAMYRAEMEEFCDALREHRYASVGLADGRAVLEITETIHQQSKETTHAA